MDDKSSLADRLDWRALVEAGPDGIVIADARGIIALANKRATELFGYTREELLGAPIELLVPDRHRETHPELRASFGRSPKQRPMGSGLRLFARRKGGDEIPVEISLSPLLVNGESFVSATIRDVTERATIEEELRKASSAKSEFLASMSHELRTPLNAILGFAQLLHRDKRTPLSGRQKDMIEQVMKGGEHLVRLIDEVLDLARIEAGRVTISTEPVNVIELLEHVQSTLGPLAASADVALTVSALPEGLPDALADRVRLGQILMNFGSNAIKYGRPRGHATFSVARPSPDKLRISVIDDGIGIPKDEQRGLFQPFYRAGQETGPIQGTGIGLTITKRLAELMGGDIGFTSEQGRGSTFWVDLPVAPEVRPSMSLPQSLRGGALFNKPGDRRYLVVYVEDNPANIAFMEALVDDLSVVDLVTAHTAEIGLALVHDRKPDVVIMDVNLPGMNGIEALRRLKASSETRHIPVIGLSAAAMKEDLHRAKGHGFYRYLTKPVRVEELVSALEAVLDLH